MKSVFKIFGIFILVFCLTSCKGNLESDEYNFYDYKGLSKEMQKEIYDHYAIYRNVDKKELKILEFLGEYNGVYVITMNVLDYRAELPYPVHEEDSFGVSRGVVTFEYINEGDLFGYYDGNFYSISTIYSLKLMTLEEVIELYYYKITSPNVYNERDKEDE